MQTAKDVLKAIKDNDVKYVDFRFTDPRGKWQHVTFDVSMVDTKILPSPMRPVCAALRIASTAPSTIWSARTISSFTFGRKSTTYSAPR